jgi:DNA polymerase-3 subunit gamma/tau
MLAKLAQGGMRDAISLLELCAGGRHEVTVEAVEESVGLSGRGAMLSTINAVADKDYDTLFDQIAEIVRSSKDIGVFLQDLISVYRDMLVIKTTKSASSYLDLTDDESLQLKSAADRFRKETILYHCKLLEDAFFATQKNNSVKRVVVEMTLVRMCDEALDTSSEAMLSRIAQLEEQIATGRIARSEPKATAKTEAPKVEEPIPEVKKEAPTPKAPAAAAQNKRVLRRMQNWMEVVERIGRSAPMDAGFIRMAHAFTQEDGAVVVRFDNSFTKDMMEKDESRDRLRAALSAVLRREVGDRMLIMEVVGSTQDKPSVIDEIIEASEEI